MAMLCRSWKGNITLNNKKKTSRFDHLIDAARSRKQRRELQGVSDDHQNFGDKAQSTNDQLTSQSKSTSPDYTRTTIYLPKQLHRQLKATAASQERQMSDILTELVEQWLLSKSQGKDGQ